MALLLNAVSLPALQHAAIVLIRPALSGTFASIASRSPRPAVGEPSDPAAAASGTCASDTMPARVTVFFFVCLSVCLFYCFTAHAKSA